MRSDHVSYFPPLPQPAGERGRKPKRGAEFAFEVEATQPVPSVTTVTAITHYGKAVATAGTACIRYWSGARPGPATPKETSAIPGNGPPATGASHPCASVEDFAASTGKRLSRPTHRIPQPRSPGGQSGRRTSTAHASTPSGNRTNQTSWEPSPAAELQKRECRRDGILHHRVRGRVRGDRGFGGAGQDLCLSLARAREGSVDRHLSGHHGCEGGFAVGGACGHVEVQLGTVCSRRVGLAVHFGHLIPAAAALAPTDRIGIGVHRHRAVLSTDVSAKRSGLASERCSVPGSDTAPASQSLASRPARSSPRRMAAPGSRCAKEACQVLGGSWRTGSLLAATAGRRRRESRYTKTHGAIRTAQPIASVMPPPTMTTAHTIHAVTVRTAAAMSHLTTLPASRELWELRCELSISSPLHLSCTRRRYLPASASRPMIIVAWATLRKVVDRLQRKTSAQAQTRHRGQRDRTIFPLLNNFDRQSGNDPTGLRDC